MSPSVCRPLLHYPAAACHPYYHSSGHDVAALLVEDASATKAEGHEPGLSEPNVQYFHILVEARTFPQNPAVASRYLPLFIATRPFPWDVAANLALPLAWIDVSDVRSLLPR
ncbi:hypothetical protein N657DRAFT_682496 [Parathielavia appendiculata]|uniref:Uncharacterized protein n=1 Tax=Parathielavia appendiculata TaxID=2587402 RepID=A0AAN6Z1M0_9PEZI|nr:hypothetical protein N657DRAFT_682496 [Parathielavia appendiculata]